MKRTIGLFSLVLAVAVLLSACGPVVKKTVVPQVTPQAPAQATSTAKPGAEISNPATKNCVDQGYESEIRTAADGSQYGVCKFLDKTECEEWSYFRGECKQGQYEVAPTPTVAP